MQIWYLNNICFCLNFCSCPQNYVKCLFPPAVILLETHLLDPLLIRFTACRERYKHLPCFPLPLSHMCFLEWYRKPHCHREGKYAEVSALCVYTKSVTCALLAYP